MKRFALVLLMCALLAVTAFADGLGYELKLTYDAANNGVVARLGVSQGDSVAAHIGFVYNTEKLQLVQHNFQSIPDTVPEGMSADAYLGSIIKSSAQNVHITQEYADANSLINEEKGHVMFGWYADFNVNSIFEGEEIATFCFKLNDGVSYSDITAIDVSPILKTYTQDITGWSSGIMVANVAGERYFYEPGAANKKLDMTVMVVPSDEAQIPVSGSETGNAATDTTVTGDTAADTTATGEETGEIQTVQPVEGGTLDDSEIVEMPVTGSETLATADFGVDVNAFSDRIRVLWNKPESFKISEYRLLISDKDGQVIKKITGITDITKSFTVKSLAQDYEFIVSLAAVKPDGTLVYHDKLLMLKTPVSTSSAVLIYNVTYEADAGSLYGMTSEQVMFGSHATKAPTVYAPDGYEFAGWSVDGKTIENLGELRIYSDTVFTAVYTKK